MKTENSNDELLRLKKVGYTLIGITGLIFIILLIRKPFSNIFFVFSFLLAGILIQTLKYPFSLSKTEKILIKVGAVLGWINTRIILIILFYIVITPLSFLIKFFGKSTIKTGFDKSQTTYWIDHTKIESKDTLKRQF